MTSGDFPRRSGLFSWWKFRPPISAPLREEAVQQYILRRTGQSVIALFLLSIIVFGVVRLTGDPSYLLIDEQNTEEQRLEIRRALGLDRHVVIQYGLFVGNFLQGDFGRSVRGRTPVKDQVVERIMPSVKLAGAAIVFILVTAVPLGVIAAVKKGTIIDSGAKLIAVLGQSLPSFWLGIILIEIFAVQLDLLPTQGMGGFSHYILPAFTLSLFLIAGVMRLLRSSMLDVLDSEYIKLARVKGLSETGVIWKHALRNSLIAVVTFGGTYIAALITLAILVEVVFAWPGLGRLVFNGIINRDFPLVQTLVILTGALVIFVNLLVDILYAYLDPRVRFE
ncbi:MAG: ABC transporter permease [Chloroflexi bacterium]|nr:ABC transporter permease [Chloroflexota bacterium]MYE38639.1 ABC transporter permease [Chloroflexota bacterium]